MEPLHMIMMIIYMDVVFGEFERIPREFFEGKFGLE